MLMNVAFLAGSVNYSVSFTVLYSWGKFNGPQRRLPGAAPSAVTAWQRLAKPREIF
jgi:hypothetical protein